MKISQPVLLCFLFFIGLASVSGKSPRNPTHTREALGEPVGTVIIQGAAFGQGADGENLIFFATNGNPATFYALDAETQKPVFSAPLPGLDVIWAITRGADGNIYFAGTRGGHLFRYLPKEQKIEDLGHNGTSDTWIWDLTASQDGKIYGGTYPKAEIFEYDIEEGTLQGWAAGYSEQNYVRGVGVTENHVYAGAGTPAHLYRIDRETGQAEEIPTPATGDNTMFGTTWAYGGKILSRIGSLRVLVYDEETLEPIRGANDDYLSINYTISPPSPENPDLIYYKNGENLFSYNLTSNEVQKIDLSTILPGSPVRGWDWITLRQGEKKGRTVLLGMMEFGELMQYDPKDKSMEIHYAEVQPQGVLVQALELGPDDRLYIGGYQAGMSIYDPATNEVVERFPQFSQPEGIGFFDDKVYFGTYGSARIFSLDPSEPSDFGYTPKNNPGLDFSVGYHQDRPFILTSSEDKLFIGTVPGYGSLGGALTVYDKKTDKWEVFPDLIKDQSIIGLAYRDGKLYGTTSIFGGLGIKPTAKAPKMFVWDVASKKLIREWTPEIPEIDEAPKALGGLSFGPDGKLWVAAYGTIFVMDPKTFEIERSKLIVPSNWNVTHYWRPVYLRWAPDGRLFTTLGWKLVVIDPKTLESEIWDNSSLMTLYDGYVYYAKGSKLFRLPMNR